LRALKPSRLGRAAAPVAAAAGTASFFSLAPSSPDELALDDDAPLLRALPARPSSVSLPSPESTRFISGATTACAAVRRSADGASASVGEGEGEGVAMSSLAGAGPVASGAGAETVAWLLVRPERMATSGSSSFAGTRNELNALSAQVKYWPYCERGREEREGQSALEERRREVRRERSGDARCR